MMAVEAQEANAGPTRNYSLPSSFPMASHSDSTAAFLQGGEANYLFAAVDRYK
jgi:hypothetical protein